MTDAHHATIRAALEEYTHFLAEDEKPPIVEAIAWLDTLAAGQWIPISGNIVIEANGKLYTVTPGVIGDWNLPDDIRLCRLTNQPDALKAMQSLGYRPATGDGDA